MVAPSFFSSFAARVMVLAVSAKSSTRIQGRSCTSPTSIMVAFCRSEILVGRRSCVGESVSIGVFWVSRSYLVNQSKAQAQIVGDRSSTLRPTCIWTDDDRILGTRNLSLNVPLQQRLSVEIIDGNVKEPLVSLAQY